MKKQFLKNLTGNMVIIWILSVEESKQKHT